MSLNYLYKPDSVLLHLSKQDKWTLSIAVTKQGKAYKHGELVQQFPPHLQALLAVEEEPPRHRTGVIAILRKLLKWLFLPVRLLCFALHKRIKRRKQPEILTSEGKHE